MGGGGRNSKAGWDKKIMIREEIKYPCTSIYLSIPLSLGWRPDCCCRDKYY